MHAYQTGDRAAADQLIQQLSPALHRYFTLQTNDRRHADDLLQELWLRIHKTRHTYRPGEPLLPWVYAIARYTKLDHYRKRRAEQHEASLTDVPEPAAVKPIGTGADWDWLMSQLPASQREVVTMLKISGLSLEEVARATASSVGSVKQKAHRAYEKLRTLLAGTGEQRP